jgi:hypothetical protein
MRFRILIGKTSAMFLLSQFMVSRMSIGGTNRSGTGTRRMIMGHTPAFHVSTFICDRIMSIARLFSAYCFKIRRQKSSSILVNARLNDENHIIMLWRRLEMMLHNLGRRRRWLLWPTSRQIYSVTIWPRWGVYSTSVNVIPFSLLSKMLHWIKNHRHDPLLQGSE